MKSDTEKLEEDLEKALGKENVINVDDKTDTEVLDLIMISMNALTLQIVTITHIVAALMTAHPEIFPEKDVDFSPEMELGGGDKKKLH